MALGISAAAWAAIGAVGSVAVGAYAASEAGDAAEEASEAQSEASRNGITEQRRQFDAIQKLLSPYVNAGTGALSGQQDLLGLNGNGAQGSAISALQNSAQFKALTQQGENAILQNASATGGLRGGNTQGALAEFRPAMLSALINDQYSKLSGLTSVGQNAAAGVGNAGMATGNNITNLLGQIGSAQAGNALAQGRANIGMANSFASGIGSMAGYGGFRAGGGGGSMGSPLSSQFTYGAPTAGFGTDEYGNALYGGYGG